MSVAVNNNCIVNVLRIKGKKIALCQLKLIAQVKRFMVGILHHKCAVKRAT